MTKTKLEQLFGLARELYAEEAKKREPMLTPYCWAKNSDTGEFLVFSASSRNSREIELLLEQHIFSEVKW